MKRLIVLGIAVSVILAAAYAGITVFDEYMRFGRMWETPAIRPHETPLLVMGKESIPVDGGEAVLRAGGAEKLENPDRDRSMKRVFAGKAAYTRYCIHCHGKDLKGQATVGQSFSAPAMDLKSPQIRDRKDGMLFSSISYGKDRMPPLATTVSVPERWDIIVYLRAAAANPALAGR
jgi:mono/diheme cytochrome c family protein